MSKKSILVVCRQMRGENFVKGLKELTTDMDVRLWPDAGDVSDVEYALVWKPPEGSLKALPNLKVVFSMGAGVDHVLGTGELPDVPLVRFVDPDLTMRMTEYVCLHVLLHHRRMLDYRENQSERRWKEYWPQPSAREIRVGILGLGVLGNDAAEKLSHLGYQVAGWSRTRKILEGIETFAGEAELDAFLKRTDILVSLLPHTPETDRILNRGFLAKLSDGGPLPGPVLINAGRGKLQVAEGILAALDADELWAASLDVFEEEPLSADSPLWGHRRIVITPHNASISNDKAVCRYTIDQIERFETGKPLENVVDTKRGY